jgi:hypothetical protein
MSKVSLSDFARHVGISRTTARDLELQSVIDRTKGIDACRLGYIAHLRARRLNGSAAADALRAARAREIEVRTAERERKLIPVEELNIAWDFCVGALVANLISCRPAAPEILRCDRRSSTRLMLRVPPPLMCTQNRLSRWLKKRAPPRCGDATWMS